MLANEGAASLTMRVPCSSWDYDRTWHLSCSTDTSSQRL